MNLNINSLQLIESDESFLIYNINNNESEFIEVKFDDGEFYGSIYYLNEILNNGYLEITDNELFCKIENISVKDYNKIYFDN